MEVDSNRFHPRVVIISWVIYIALINLRSRLRTERERERKQVFYVNYTNKYKMKINI